MSWIFTPIEIANGITKADPEKVKLELVTGRVRKVAVFMPATTTDNLVGVRINSPKGLIFPTLTKGSDDWIYSYTGFYHQLFETRIDLEEVSPVRMIVEGFNSEAAATKIPQVGIYVEPYQSEVEVALHKLLVSIEAMKRLSIMPDLEKDIRRLITFLLGGTEDD